MINWELLYNRLLETKSSDKGEKHHIVPKHDGGRDEDGLVILERRYHVLAHYIRFRWKGQMSDKVAYRIMSGQILNPMHDEDMLKKHKDIMKSKKVRDMHSVSMCRVWKDSSKRQNVLEGRKAWIDSLENKSILTNHLNTVEAKALSNSKKREFYASKSDKFIVSNGYTTNEFELKADLIKKMRVDPTTIDKYVNTDREIRIGNLKGYKIFTVKRELV